MKVSVLLAIFGLLLPSSFALTCIASPSTWSYSQYAGNSASQSFAISADGDVGSVSLYAVGSHGNWYSFPQTINFSANNSNFTATVNIPANTSGENFTSNILAVGNCTFMINITGENKGTQQPTYGYTLTRYVSKGESITIKPFNMRLDIRDVQDFIQFDEFIGSSKRQAGVIIEQGEAFDEEDGAYKMTLVKTYSASGMAKLKFESSEQITVQISKGTAECALKPNWNSLNFEVIQGESTEQPISIRNSCEAVVALQNIQITPIGSSIFKLPTGGTKDLQPSEIFPVQVKVDGTNAEVGTYSATLRLSGYLPDGNLLETSIPLSVAITEGAIPLLSGKESQFDIPQSVKINEEVVLSATNVPCRDCIRMEFEPVSVSCPMNTVSLKNNIWSVKCKFQEVAIYTVSMTPMSPNGLPTGSASGKREVFAGLEDVKLDVQVEPALKAGQESAIRVIETYYGREVANATLTGNGLPIAGKYTPAAGINTTSLCASKSPYISVCKDFPVVPARQIGNVIVSPAFPFENDTIVVSVFDTDGVAANATFLLDGTAVGESFAAEEGEHKISVNAGFGSSEKSFRVYGSPLITGDSEGIVNQMATVKFSKQAPYEIFYFAAEGADGQFIASGDPTTEVSFNLTKTGYYMVASGASERTIRAGGVGILEGMGNTYGIPNWILIPVLVVLALFGYMWYSAGKSQSFAVGRGAG